MIYPVTPNGVEHADFFGRTYGPGIVIYPVTPNGVEHTNDQLTLFPDLL